MARLLKEKELPEDATAQQIMQRLIEDYALEAYSPAEQRILAGVRYEMDLSDFSSLTRFTMAESVDVATVTAIKERPGVLSGRGG